MTIAMVTEAGEKHGLINVLANSVKDTEFSHMTPENKTKAEKLRKEESRKVKARYMNHRGINERLSKPYCRWAGDPIQMWHFIPGHIYEVPMGLVNEVNASYFPKRSDLLDASGKPTLKDSYEKVHEFVPVSF